jgi:hypothetical protein
MVEIWGRSLTRRELDARVGARQQLYGVDLMEYADGAARGVRLLRFRSGAGLAFAVLVDRSFDIGELEFRGVPLSWASGSGFRSPDLHNASDEQGSGFLRSFSGFLCTCGFDHIRQPERGSAVHFGIPARTAIDYPLHGRGAFQPGQLVGYGERWDGDDCTLWCEGRVVQAAVNGEYLVLSRRIETRVGGATLTISDEVVNQGFAPTPHMLLYHVNFGWPLLDEGARFRAPIGATRAANHPRAEQQVGCFTQAGPQPQFRQQLFDHDVVADQGGRVGVALINDRLGLGVAIDYDARALPCLQQLQAFAEGRYFFAVEPATARWGTRAAAEERGEVPVLAHGETRRYETTISVLGAEDIVRFDERIDRLTPTRPPEFPERRLDT